MNFSEKVNILSLDKFYNLFLVVIVAFLSQLLPSLAFARISGEAEIGYVNYDARNVNSNFITGNSLSQHYSLLVEEQGKIINERLGNYTISLGYDWASFNTAVHTSTGENESLDVSRGHLLYRGDVIVNPKELPIRLHMYSKDMDKISFTSDDRYQSTKYLGNAFTGSALNVVPPFITGIQDGTHIESGATLVMGVKNGMTNGYSELLRHFPMLMLDYKDEINRDVNATSPVDNRLSRLAFVSLNKKDNWFHYRLISYHDYIDASNNYSETQFQLGTVDHLLQRRWIDFSNWISVSVDGQMTKRVNSILGGQSYNELDLNLFAVARRSSWELATYNNFNRHSDDSGLITYRTTAPLYSSGVLSPDTSWSARFAFNETRDNKGSFFDDVVSAYRIDMLKRSSFAVTNEVSIETVGAEQQKKLLTLSGVIEAVSTSRFSREFSVGTKYIITSYDAREKTIASNQIDQSLQANVIYTPTQNLRMSFSEQGRVANGQSLLIASSASNSNTQTPQAINPRGQSSGSFSQSVSTLFLSWTPRQRVNFDLSSVYDVYMPTHYARSIKQSSALMISYTDQAFKAQSRTEYISDGTDPQNIQRSVSNESRLNYSFSRNLDTSLSSIIAKDLSDKTDSTTLALQESLNYSMYKVNGVVRKILEINQNFKHQDVLSGNTASSAIGSRESNFSLGAKYYPVKQLVFGVGSNYKFYANNISNYDVTYYGQAGLNFKLLQTNLEYVYGKRKADGLIEKKFTANFKKTF